MKRCVIVCAGEKGELAFSQTPEDFVICCDAGYLTAQERGIAPDLLLGDFDSYEGELPDDLPVQRFPVEKDDTDTMLALREGLRRGYREFLLLFSLGGRLDHTIANLQCLAFLAAHGARGELWGPQDRVYWVENTVRRFPHRPGYNLSVFCYGAAAEEVTLTGVQYPLSHGRLTNRFPIGLGNHITADEAVVSVGNGTLLVLESEIR